MKGYSVVSRRLVFCCIVVGAMAGCGTPTPVPRPTDSAPGATFVPTLPQQTVFPTATIVPTGAPTSTLAPPTASLATQTPIRPTVTPTATVISSIAPGLYATAIRLSPAKPTSGTDPVVFHVTFVNTTGKPVTFKWKVKIWSPNDSRNSFGEPSALTSEIQPGVTEVASAADWKTNPGPCTPFYVRVYNVNPEINADPIEFRKPDGSPGPRTDFQVCPP